MIVLCWYFYDSKIVIFSLYFVSLSLSVLSPTLLYSAEFQWLLNFTPYKEQWLLLVSLVLLKVSSC